MVEKILESNPSVKVVFMSGTPTSRLPECHGTEFARVAAGQLTDSHAGCGADMNRAEAGRPRTCAEGYRGWAPR
jgi:hypothetical protein